MTDDISDYEANLPFARQVHKGRLSTALKREQEAVREEMEQTGIGRRWWAYQGREVRPFVAYTRFQPHRLVIAVIAGDRAHTGRMTKICAALERHAFEAGISLRFEAVFNKGLEGFLRARGYRSADPNVFTGPDLIFDPRNP